MRLEHLLAAGLCVAVAFGGSCDSNEETAETPTATASSTPSPGESVSPSPIPTEDFGPSSATIEPASEPVSGITIEGRYLLDVQEGRLYRASGMVAFSSDGRLAAVNECCSAPGGLAVIDLLTWKRREVARGYLTFVSWSPVGRQLLYTRMEGGPIAFGPTGIYIWDAESGESRQVSGIGDFRGLGWSREGTHLQYIRGSKFYLMDQTTGSSSVLLDFGPDVYEESIGAVYSPQGDRIAGCVRFGNPGPESREAVMVYDIDTRQVSNWGNVDSCQAFAWSPDGTQVLVGGYGDAYAVSEGGSRLLAPTVRGVGWSPDGNQLAYVTDGCVTGEFDLFVSNADGSAPRPLTHTPGEVEEGLSWSPDGKQLSFAVSEQVVVIDLSSGVSRVVAASASDISHLHGAGWSGNGRYLYLSLAGGHGICD